jgi:hypothetical protein
MSDAPTQFTVSELQQKEHDRRAQEARERRLKVRKEVLERLSLDTKTPEDHANAALYRAQLYRFLVSIHAPIKHGGILMSRSGPNSFWCQTGFNFQDGIVFYKHGDTPYQPLGYDNGKEFFMLGVGKTFWIHDFAMVSPEGDPTEGTLKSPFDVKIVWPEVKEVQDPDGTALTDAERAQFTKIYEVLEAELNWAPGPGWKRDVKFTPPHAKAKYGTAGIAAEVQKWLTDSRRAEFRAEARRRAMATSPVPHVEPDADVVTVIAEAVGKEALDRFTLALQKETEPYSEDEIDALALRDEKAFRVRETLKTMLMQSPRLDRKVSKFVAAEHPGVGDDLRGIEIRGFTGQIMGWIRMKLEDDSIARVVTATVVTPSITMEDIRAVESGIASGLLADVVGAREAITRAGGVAVLADNCPELVDALDIIERAEVALPAVKAALAPVRGDVFFDRALEIVEGALHAIIDFKPVVTPVAPEAAVVAAEVVP